jgi:hypothetical protein
MSGKTSADRLLDSYAAGAYPLPLLSSASVVCVTEITQRVPRKLLISLIRKVDRCKPLLRGGVGR